MDPSEYQDTFSIFDTKGDNKISLHQLGDVLRAIGHNPTEADIAKCQESLKSNTTTTAANDQRISFDTFVPIEQEMAKKAKNYSLDEMVDGLRHFDNDGNGTIGSAELRRLLTALGEKMSDEEVEAVLDGVPTTDDGLVNYEHLIKHIMSA